jgi:hypothetical protein
MQPQPTTRRAFLHTAALTASGLVVFSDATYGQQKDSLAIPKRPDPLQPTLVRDFVIAGHGQFDKTKEMLAKTPSLLNATWDWGGGDFETALGGASHMGNREIAEFLIAQGARMDIFAAAMLGKLDVVKMMIAAYPTLKDSRGPHGITLLTHAQKGGSQAVAVVSYLQSLSK